MELHNGNLYVSPRELRALGVSANTVDVGVSRARKGKPGWKTEPVGPHSAELIRYDSIPTRTAQAVGLPAAAALIAQLEQQQAQQAAHQSALQADAVADELAAYVEATYQQYENALLPLVRRDKPTAEAHARLQAAFEWCEGPGTAHPQAAQLAAFLTLDGLPFRPQPTRTGAENPDAARASFARKLARYRAAADKPAALVNKHTAKGNANARKVTPEGVAFLVKLQQQNRPKLPVDELLTRYNTAASAQGWDVLRSVQTVRNVLNATRPQWEGPRHGTKYASQKMGYTYARRRASFPDARIEIDGTEEPIYYRTGRGEAGSSLYCVRVIDCHSGAIVGSAYGEGGESNKLITLALRDYLERYRRRPHQLNYDGGIAGKQKAGRALTPMQTLLGQMTHLNFPTTSGRPQARRIEGILGELQRSEISQLDFYRGSNITSQRDQNRKANEDWLLTLKAKKGRETLPTFDQAEAALRECERRYNEQLDTKRNARRIDLYTADYPQRVPVTTAEIVSLFMSARPQSVKWTNKGLVIQIGADRLAYETREADDETALPDLDFYALAAANGTSFTVYDDPANRDVIWIRPTKGGEMRPAFRKHEFPEAVADALPGEGERRAQIAAKNKALLAGGRCATPPTDAVAPVPDAAPLGIAELGTAQSKAAWNAANAREERRHHGLLDSSSSPFTYPDNTLEFLD